MRLGSDEMPERFAEEVIQHLSTLPGAVADVVLEIRVKVEGGIKEDIVRRVRENAKTLKFDSNGFERE